MNKELLVAYLEKVAAEAKILADLVRTGKNWPGDLSQGMTQLSATVMQAKSYVGDDR